MKDINGRTRICGLMANPVGHTLSPLIHNTLAERMNINMAYVPFEPKKNELDAAVKGAYALNILGLNVSVPHKVQVMDSLSAIDPVAAAIGAVNTLVRIEGGYQGYNTDITGLKRAMEMDGVEIKDRQVVILGAGGVAQTAAHLCAGEGAAGIWILNRTYENAVALAKKIEGFYYTKCTPFRTEDFRELPKNRYLVIQTTSVGMYPNVDHAAIEEEEFYQMVETAYDLVYTPFETMFMKYAVSCGAKAYNGLRMLLYQGICAYEIWNHTVVPEEVAEEIYALLKKELKVK